MHQHTTMINIHFSFLFIICEIERKSGGGGKYIFYEHEGGSLDGVSNLPFIRYDSDFGSSIYLSSMSSDII